jgi:hypothetical protein
VSIKDRIKHVKWAKCNTPATTDHLSRSGIPKSGSNMDVKLKNSDKDLTSSRDKNSSIYINVDLDKRMTWLFVSR